MENREVVIDRVQKNPFAVSKEDLAQVNLDLVITLSKDRSSLRAKPKYRSKAKKLVAAAKNSQYLTTEKLYYIPVEELSELLKKLRDNNLSFAVEAQAGEALKKSADIRSDLIHHPSSADGFNLHKAMLGPYLDLIQDKKTGSFKFYLQTHYSSQLKELVRFEKDFRQRKLTAQSLNFSELSEVLYNHTAQSYPLWLTASLRELLLLKKDELSTNVQSGEIYDEETLYLAAPFISWVESADSRLGLLIEKDFYEKLIQKDKDFPLLKNEPESISSFNQFYFFHILDSNLAQSFKDVNAFLKQNEYPIYFGKRFSSNYRTICNRQKFFEVKESFLKSPDFKLDLINQELEAKLYPHQRTAVGWLLQTPFAYLGDDMGLGKTLTVLTYYQALLEQEEVDFLLVVCPNSLTRNWIREASQWLPEICTTLLPSQKKEREQFLEFFTQSKSNRYQMLVINYEAARIDTVAKSLLKFTQKRKVLLALDEAQRVKNPKSKTFQALKDLAPYSKRRILLSGTPTPRDIADIWSQFYILDLGERFGTNYYSWLENIAELGTKYSKFAIKKYIPEQVTETIKRTHEILFRRKKDEVVNLPEKTFSTRDINLSGEQLKRYEALRQELLLMVTSKSGKEFFREIDNILEEYLRAVQISSNPRLVDPEWKGDPAKFLELDTIVNEIVEQRGEKIVVWTNFLKNVGELVERYKHLGAAAYSGEVSTADRDKAVQQFQDASNKKLTILVAVPAAGGVGITLTAAQTAVYLDKSWNGEHWMQSIDRVHRIGQTGTVNIISLNATKVDELISRNLFNKQKAQERILGDNNQQMEPQDLNPSRDELIDAVRIL